MKVRKILFIVWAAGFAVSCGNAVVEEPKEIPLPEGAIPAVYDGHWYLAATINDSIAGSFVFDTGADGLYFDSLYCSTAGLKFDNLKDAVLPGAGEGVQRIPLILDTLQVSLEPLSDSFAMTPIMQLKPILGKKADGIIGKEFLKNYIVEFNYEREYLRILPADSLKNLEGYKQFPMERKRNRLFLKLPVAVSDSLMVDGVFLVDMGSGGLISFTSAAAQQYDFRKHVKKSITHYTQWGGVGGTSSSADFRGRAVQIGDFSIQDPLLSYSFDKHGALARESYQGLVGNGLLEHFHAVFDFPNSVLYLKPNNNYNKRERLSKSGFSYVDRTDIFDGFVVNGLYKEANAEKAGLQIGDIITHIAGKPVKEAGINLKAIWGAESETQDVLLTIQRGGDTLSIRLPLVDPDI